MQEITSLLSIKTYLVTPSMSHAFSLSHFKQIKHSDIVDENKTKGIYVWNTFYLHSTLHGQLYEIESDHGTSLLYISMYTF